MQTISGENELFLTCRPIADGLCILRCETADRDVFLPDAIAGQPVTALGDYALSARAPQDTPPDAFSVRITCGGALPKHDAAALRTLHLPRALRSIGSYAFYNCTDLRHLFCGPNLREVGGGALMNCRALHHLTFLSPPDAPTGLSKLLDESAQETDVTFSGGGQEARLLFPAYDEELQDLSPAHIFQRRIHGAGYAYRQCFVQGALSFLSYDRAFPELLTRHDFLTAARVAIRRLLAPFELTDQARDAYLDCLRVHGGPLACRLAARNDSAGLRFLCRLAPLSPADHAAACTAARQSGSTAALSVLLEQTGRQPAPGRARSFDL